RAGADNDEIEEFVRHEPTVIATHPVSSRAQRRIYADRYRSLAVLGMTGCSLNYRAFLNPEQQALGILDAFLDPHQEQHGLAAVDDAVGVGAGGINHGPPLDLAVHRQW